jgi:NAD+ kinase
VSNEKNYIHPQILNISINNKKKYNAMNELVIQSLNTIKMSVNVDNHLYENFMGTGILVATHTGATGQAKSNGGPIFLPSVEAFELIELAPTNHSKHHSFNAPLIMSSSNSVLLDNFQSAQRCDLIIDGMRVLGIKPTDKIKITCTKAKFALCFNRETTSYIEKLKNTFIKG